MAVNTVMDTDEIQAGQTGRSKYTHVKKEEKG